MSTYFYDLPTTAKRRNVYIHPSTKPGSLRILSLPEIVEGNGLNGATGAFLYPRKLRPIVDLYTIALTAVKPAMSRFL